MTNEQIKTIVEDAIRHVRYERYGLSGGFMSVRYIDKTDGDFWKIAFWLKGQVGKEILIAASRNASEETVKQEIIAAIESNLPAWRNALVT